jgi:hypothetical protein
MAQRKTNPMKNIDEVLKQKEAALQRIQRDVEALRIAARLLVVYSDNASQVREEDPDVSAVPRRLELLKT